MSTDRVESERAAEPPLMVAVPSSVAPSRNWTVPVAVAGDIESSDDRLFPLSRFINILKGEVYLGFSIE